MKRLFILSSCCLNLMLFFITSNVNANTNPYLDPQQYPNLQHTDPAQRSIAVKYFATTILSTDTSNLLKLVKFLYDPDTQVKRQVVTSLSHIKPTNSQVIQSLIKALDDPDPEVRIAANWVVDSIFIDDPEVIQILLKSLEHTHLEVRRSAAHALGSIKPTDLLVRNQLIQATEDSSDKVQVAAKWAIKQIISLSQPKSDFFTKISDCKKSFGL